MHSQLKAIHDAYCLLNLGDSITTDHISPAGNIDRKSATARFLTARGVTVEGPTDTSAGTRQHPPSCCFTNASVFARNK